MEWGVVAVLGQACIVGLFQAPNRVLLPRAYIVGHGTRSKRRPPCLSFRIKVRVVQDELVAKALDGHRDRVERAKVARGE